MVGLTDGQQNHGLYTRRYISDVRGMINERVSAIGEVEPDVFKVSTTAAPYGVYRVRFLAQGSMIRGRPFTSELLLTGIVRQGGNHPPPTSETDSARARRTAVRTRIVSAQASGH